LSFLVLVVVSLLTAPRQEPPAAVRANV
jgi:hypothetical protein